LTLPSAETVNTVLDLGSKGVGLFSGVADLAQKIENMIKGKREELLARGQDLDGAAIGKAFAESLAKASQQQRRAPFVIPNGMNIDYHPPVFGGFDGKVFHALARSLNELD
jgi:hypothetical protein